MSLAPIHPEPHGLAGKRIKIKSKDPCLDGAEFLVEDWQVRVMDGASWMLHLHSPVAVAYGVRGMRLGLPFDDRVLYGKVSGRATLIHETEIGEVIA